MALAALVVAAPFAPAPAHDYLLGDLEIIDPWARATAGLARNGAAYLTLSTRGEAVDRLLGAETPVARKAGLHGHLIENGIVKMRPVKAFEVAPGEPVVLEPGGFHIMLMGLKAPLEAGTAFPLTLRFEKAGAIEVEARVESAGAGTPDHQGDGDHGHDKGS
jgi:copper(I)-binding protein